MDDLKLDLIELGLTEKESVVYLNLLTKGAGTVLSVSKFTKLNRTTVHAVVESLLNKGFVNKFNKSGKRFLVAESPSKFKSIIDDRIIALETQKARVNDFVRKLNSTITNLQESTFVDVRLFEGVNNCRRLYDFVLSSSEIYAYVNSVAIIQLDLFPENNVKFENYLKQGGLLKDIVVNGKVVNSFLSTMQLYPTYRCKFLKCEENFNILDYMITKKGIAIIWNDQQIVSGIVIYSKPIIETSISLFKTMWDLID